MKTQRIKSVELWRLLFTVLVVLWHVKALPWCTEETRILCSGHSVDFFFLLSGWLMAARGMKQPPDGPVGAGTWRFLRDKLRSIYPTYIFALLFDIAARALLTVRHRVTWSAAAGYIWDLLFLRAAGLGRASGDTAVGAAWYLSAMLLGMLLLYPLLLRFRDRFLRLMAPAAAILLYGWFFAAHGHLYFTLNFENGICLGLLRGIAGLCLGCVCYMLDRVLKEALPRPGRALRLLATGAEVLPVLAVICLSRLFEPSRADFLCVLLEGVTLTAAFSGMSFLTELTAKLRTDWIGPFTLALYLNHVVWL
ncbi:MAG: acyltransferase family protein, partial [Oscillospiraceae bacterium]|nr:acyltransferase family protein [Oscillospiraceae bacterium]